MASYVISIVLSVAGFLIIAVVTTKRSRGGYILVLAVMVFLSAGGRVLGKLEIQKNLAKKLQ